MELSTVDLVEALVDADRCWERVALGLQLDGTVSDLAQLLDAIDPAALDGDELVSYLRLTERVTAKVAAVAQRTVALVADRTEALGLHPEDARHELAAALRLSPVTASQRVRVALELRDRFPASLALMDAGRIGYQHAAHLVRETEGLDDDTAAAVQARVLPVLGRLTAAETRRAVRDAVVRVDPAAASKRAAKQHDERRIERVPDRDGRTGWFLPLSADLEAEMWAATTATATAVQAARVAAGLEEPGLDALRVDVAVDRILGRAATTGTTLTEHPATRSRRTSSLTDLSRPSRPPRCTCGGAQTAAVVVDVHTALGLADDPGHLPGYGAIPADLARRMAADRDWIRWITDPTTGQLLDRGARRYRPGGALHAYVSARDQVCGFPGCRTPAQDCDCDHVVAFAHHGQTVRINLGPLCRQHHNAKTHGQWRLHHDPDNGLKTWTSPLGLTHTKAVLPLLT